MENMKPILDHAVINVRENLDQAVDTFTRLGFSLTPRGYHTLGSSNHLCIFGENYLELLGYESAASRPELAKQVQGLGGLVFKADDAEGLFREIQARDIPVDAPREFHRPVQTKSGTEEARFRTVNLAPHLVPNGRAFFCHHLTPHLVWQHEWQEHPNEVTDIIGFVIASEDPARSCALYEKLFDTECADDGRDCKILAAGKAAIHFMTPAAAQARFGPGTSAAPDGTDRMVAVVLQTKSLQAARLAIAQGGVASVAGSDYILVHAGQAMGAAVMFVERECL